MHAVRTLSIAGIVLLLGSAMVPVHAQGWWDRGKEMLKGMDDGSSTSSGASSLSSGQISGGLRDALRVGSERVVNTLGRADGFNKSADVHIPLPGSLKTVQSMLSKIGMSGLADDLELRLNRAEVNEGVADIALVLEVNRKVNEIEVTLQLLL